MCLVPSQLTVPQHDRGNMLNSIILLISNYQLYELHFESIRLLYVYMALCQGMFEDL